MAARLFTRDNALICGIRSVPAISLHRQSGDATGLPRRPEISRQPAVTPFLYDQHGTIKPPAAKMDARRLNRRAK